VPLLVLLALPQALQAALLVPLLVLLQALRVLQAVPLLVQRVEQVELLLV
jgi:hypothetical protein